MGWVLSHICPEPRMWVRFGEGPGAGSWVRGEALPSGDWHRSPGPTARLELPDIVQDVRPDLIFRYTSNF